MSDLFDELPEDLQDVEVIYSDGEDELEPLEEQIIDFEPENQINDAELAIDEVIDLSILTFDKHKKSVFSSALSQDQQDQNLAITGGEDDMAYLWNTITGEIILECTGHKDSITEVCFNHNVQFVATGDMAGMIQVWSVMEKKLIWCFEGEDMEWLMWHSMANILFCGCKSGEIYIWEIPSGNCKVLPSPSNVSTSCAKILPNGKQLLAGYENGQIRLWDIKNTFAVWTNSTDNESVNNIDISADGSLIIVTPKGNLFKSSDGKLVGNILMENETEIECALFNDEFDVIVSGSLSGQLSVWQLGKLTLRHQAKIEASVTVLKLGKNNKVFIGATDGAIYVCDVKSCTLLDILTGHRGDILSLNLYSDCSKILSTSDDGTAKIFQVA